MKKSGFIDSVRVKEPCSQEWDEMVGSDQVRFCTHCAKSVNNISAMRRSKAAKIVARSGGNICVRYIANPKTGGPVFVPQLVKIAGRAGLAAGLFGASLAAAEATLAQGSPAPVETVSVEQITSGDNSPAKITGTVTDPQGAVIPFAVVSITNKETGEYRALNADAEGAYEFAEVPAGRYAIKIEAAGFQTLDYPEVRVSEGSRLRQNAQLEIPQIGAVVQVGGDEQPESWGTVGGAAISVGDSNALVRAVLNDDLEEVKVRILMRERINVRDKAYDGISPLHAAVQNGNVEIARFLLERGAKVNIRDYEKRTPLMMLDEDGSAEMVQLLLSYGAKLKLVDKERNNALHHLAENGADVELVRMLINYGIDINAANKEGKTPLMVAAENVESDIASALLDSGADVNARTRDGKTALDLADGESVRSVMVAYGAPQSH